VAAINPTCSLTMRKEYPALLAGAEAKEFPAAVVDPHQVLWQLKSENLFRRDFRTTPGEIAYHVPCHLKAQAIGFRSRDLMLTIRGAAITTVDACTTAPGR
jgi:Fe-S oxidoreductase